MYTPITGTGTGAVQTVNLTFPFLDRSHIKATVDGVVRALTWTGASQVSLGTVAGGAEYLVYRETPIETPLVDFVDASVLTADDLDLHDTQLRYHQEEVDNRVSLTVDAMEARDDAQDAATAAAASQSASASSATASASSATASASSATTATTKAAEAAASAATAATKATEAATSATQADNAADAAAAAVTAVGSVISVPSAAIPATTRSALRLLVTTAPGHLMEAGRAGMFVFDSSDLSDQVAMDTAEAVYIAPASDLTGASGAWVRQFDGPLKIEWFGAVADDASKAAINYAAFNAAFGFTPLSGSVLPPKISLGYGAYHVSDTLEPSTSVHIEGQSTGEWPQDAGVNLSRIIAPTDTTVFRIRFRSEGATGNTADGTKGSAYGSILRGISFEQETMGTDLTAHGVDIRGQVHIDQCIFHNIAGDGFHVEAFTGGGARYGIADDWTVTNTTAHTVGGNGGFIIGNDANVGSTYHFHSHSAGGCGLLDNSYLGSHHYNLHATGYGNKGVHYSGTQYQLIVNDPTTAAATVPGTNPNVWWPLQAGGVTANFPEFNAADTDQMRLKLPFYTATAFSSIHGGYMEGGAVRAHGAGPVFGGLWTVTPTTPFIGSHNNSAISMPSGHGYYASGNSLNTASVGTYESLFFGTTDFQTNDRTRRRSLIEGRVASDGETSFGLRWNDSKDLEWRYLNSKMVFGMTGLGTTSTLGRTTPQPHYAGFQDLFLQDPGNTNNVRLFGIRDAAPTTGYHARGEFVFNVNPSASGILGWSCTTAGTPGTWTAVPVAGFGGSYTGDSLFSGNVQTTGAVFVGASPQAAGSYGFRAGQGGGIVYLDNQDGIGGYGYDITYRTGRNHTFQAATSGAPSATIEDVAVLGTSGLNLTTGRVYKIAGTQVVGPQGAAVAADATDLASALTLVNQLKARLRAHGLIA